MEMENTHGSFSGNATASKLDMGTQLLIQDNDKEAELLELQKLKKYKEELHNQLNMYKN